MKEPLYYTEKDALVTAAFLEDLKFFEQLIAGGADLNCQDEIGQTPLHAAAEQGRTKLVRRLLNLGAEPNVRDFDGDTPLDVALFREHTEIVVLLESIGAHRHADLSVREFFIPGRE
jgi:ankyrin repeat protein